MVEQITNVVIAGLGGQGVLKASDIFAEAVYYSGLDVKKSEIHGMSQRGGSVCSDVRFGKEVLSPMIPTGEADYLVVLSRDQVDNNLYQLKEEGILISPDDIEEEELKNKRSLNVALLGLLSTYLKEIDENLWMKAILSNLPEKIHDVNRQAFELGRNRQKETN